MPCRKVHAPGCGSAHALLPTQSLPRRPGSHEAPRRSPRAAAEAAPGPPPSRARPKPRTRRAPRGSRRVQSRERSAATRGRATRDGPRLQPGLAGCREQAFAREHGREDDQVERRRCKFEGRVNAVHLPARDVGEVRPRPCDQLPVDVRADELAVRIVAVPAGEQPPRAAADVEDRAGYRRARRPRPRERDRIVRNDVAVEAPYAQRRRCPASSRSRPAGEPASRGCTELRARRGSPEASRRSPNRTSSARTNGTSGRSE